MSSNAAMANDPRVQQLRQICNAPVSFGVSDIRVHIEEIDPVMFNNLVSWLKPGEKIRIRRSGTGLQLKIQINEAQSYTSDFGARSSDMGTIFLSAQ